ncbi:hypothetical protein D9M70_582810 [compost metagenome]
MPRGGVAQRAPGHDKGAGSLVGDVADCHSAGHLAARGQGADEAHALLAVHDAAPVQAMARIAHPEAGVGQHGRHGGQGAQPLLVDEVCFIAQGGAFRQAGAHAQGIEDAVILAIGLALGLEDMGLQAVIVQRHGRLRPDPRKTPGPRCPEA